MARKKKLNIEERLEVEEFLMNDRNNDKTLQYTINVKCKTKNQKTFSGLINEKEITIANGPAGTGKTFLACAEALKLLKTQSQYRRIILVKSVTTLKNEEIGHLKGGMEDKIMPFMGSFLDNFSKLVGEAKTEALFSSKTIEIQPLAYIRGRSIDNSIIIVDEAQNIDLDNMKTVMTRIGENSKLIIVGDTKQIDLRNKKASSLNFVVDKFSEVHPSIGTMSFDTNDIVRNPLIQVIEDIFDGE
jgi:phosphate starvation-inducible protein PhoH and related proteins